MSSPAALLLSLRSAPLEVVSLSPCIHRLQVLNSGSNNCSSYTKCVHLDSSSVASTANCTSSSEHDEDDIDRRKREVELEVATAAGQSREEMVSNNYLTSCIQKTHCSFWATE